MNINIDYTKRTPIYEQIVSEVERMATLGLLKKEEALPSIRELAFNLGINPNMVKKAYDVLESLGIIISRSTKGTFLNPDIAKARSHKISSLLDEINIKIKELENYNLTRAEIIDLLNSKKNK